MANLKPHQVGQAGEHFVAAELHRRGAYAVTFSGNMPNIDVLASDAEHGRQAAIQVKTKTSGTWHTSTERGAVRTEADADNRFWVLVDIGRDPAPPPAYFIVPEWWIRNHIHERYQAYLASHGGQRPRNPRSTHFAIKPRDVEQWRDRWELLPVLVRSPSENRDAIRASDGHEHRLGPAKEVAAAMKWLSDQAACGSGGGRWSHLLGDFVHFYREDTVFARDYIEHLAAEAADLLELADAEIPAPASRVLKRIAAIPLLRPPR